MNGKQNDNVVLFPNMAKNLLKKAFTAKKEKRYEEAKELFSFMWEEKIGQRRLWLPYYLSCLIQLEDYESISRVLHKASKEEEFQDLVDQFREISRACEVLANEGEEKQFTRETVLNKIQANADYYFLLEEHLYKGNFEQQLHAIEQLKHIHTGKTVEALKNYLLLDGPEPILKTFALRALKEMGEKGEILIHKFGHEYRTRIEDVPLQDQDVPEKEWKVLEKINEMTDKDNAAFFPFAFQLWMEYLFSIYPSHPRVHNPASWAAALHYATSRLLHFNQSQKEVARLYGVSVSIVSRKYKSLNNVLLIDARIR